MLMGRRHVFPGGRRPRWRPIPLPKSTLAKARFRHDASQRALRMQLTQLLTDHSPEH